MSNNSMQREEEVQTQFRVPRCYLPSVRNTCRRLQRQENCAMCVMYQQEDCVVCNLCYVEAKRLCYGCNVM